MTSLLDFAWKKVARNNIKYGMAMVVLALMSQQASSADQVSISDGGTPSYSLPISVPPGIAGMAPNIGLLYSGGGVNGPVGYGWALQGISMITRCPGNKATDGRTVPVKFNGNDKLCLDGQRLIQTNADGEVLNPGSMPFQPGDSLGGNGLVREYRTEKDMYARIRAYGMAGGNPANGPAYFKVWTKSGQIYEYGVNGNASANANITADAPVDANGNSSLTTRPVVTVWPVSRIADTVGNYMDFQYEQRNMVWGSQTGSNAGHEWNLTEIRYTGNGTQAPTNRIVFEYSDRPDTPNQAQDRSEAYHNGVKNVSVRLLKKIHTYINWPAAQATQPAGAIRTKVIKLSYDQGPRSGRSRVTSIAECMGANEQKCLPATTFAYSKGGSLAYSQNTLFRNGPLLNEKMLPGTVFYGAMVGSFFGSGRTDILRWSDNPWENGLYESTGKGNFVKSAKFNITDQNLFKSDGCYSSVVADFNGDGLSDILRTMVTTSVNDTSCGPKRNVLYLSNGDGSFRPIDVTADIDFTTKAIFNSSFDSCVRNCDVIDQPMLMKSPSAAPVAAAMASRMSEHQTRYTQTEGRNFYLIDVNGDGILDIITTVLPGYKDLYEPELPNQMTACAKITCTRLYLGQQNGSFVEASTNLIHTSVYATPGGTGLITMDINGDGLSDLASSFSVLLSLGNGDFVESPAAGSCAGAMDFNGDGKSDCLDTALNARFQRLWLSNGSQMRPQVTNFNLINPGDELISFSTGIQFSSNAHFVDMDGDGRTDILRWGDDTSKNAVFLSNGDGTFRRSDTFNITEQLQHSNGRTTMLLGDFTGSGTTEILRLFYPTPGAVNTLFVRDDPTPADQLISVTSGMGLTTTLNWVLLSNSDSGALGPRYISDRGTANAAAYPLVDLVVPTYAVASTVSDTGVGKTQQTTQYRYAGMKSAYDGRGFLGFREIRRQSEGPNGEPMTVTTQYLQNGADTGMAAWSETWLASLATPRDQAQVLSRSSYVYCDRTAPAGAEARATETAPCMTGAKVRRPYLYRSVETGKDLAGNDLPTVTTTNIFNDSGDATQIVMQTTGTALGLAQTFTKTSTNTYFPNTIAGDAWILGRLKKASVANEVPNHLPLIATATTGPVDGVGSNPPPPKPPVNNIDLSAILSLLLDDD
ncbi:MULTISPECIES: FG-GAP-like repeat-containing protein [unclassified Janthinobacterium]|uniref:FG-GAP-like repeat-containing protein n=1 Tax=unclassified Janthinobacterium TaxID=2610881 RepID=UPI00161D0004|nr:MULTISPECIES: FG-GAP-like repeat-containing protein [unclassified Janthinobacterium]MBB5370209.1 hypothetical protein [Janthinobacterium sp. K2C7]MBB5383015.1 hypothetical protein [Janthinobacterium sp. K2Li3]MBB5388506.1 hypothetical protein [Janthinobacterium sp. K2E3]